MTLLAETYHAAPTPTAAATDAQSQESSSSSWSSSVPTVTGLAPPQRQRQRCWLLTHSEVDCMIIEGGDEGMPERVKCQGPDI